MNQTDDAPQLGKPVFRLSADTEETLEKLRRRLALDFSDLETTADVERVTFDDTASRHSVRQWIGTLLPIFLNELTEIFHYSNRLGSAHSRPGAEPLSIEPGYVTSSKAVMARRTDDFCRIYLGPGAYAEPVARLSEGVARPYAWTPAGESDPATLEFFLRVREQFVDQPTSQTETAK